MAELKLDRLGLMATMERAYRVRPPKEVTHTSGPWYGVRDDIQPVSAEPKYVQRLQNMWLRDLPHVPYADSRPGMRQIGSQMGDIGAGTGDGSLSSIITGGIGFGQLLPTEGYGAFGISSEPLGGYGQRWFQFTKLDGATYTVGFCAGHVYTLDWGSNTTTEILTTAELLTAGIVVDPLARVYCAVMANTLIVSDGVHKPWQWDGTAHGGLTLMTNAPVLFGPLAVHYAKLMGIKESEPNTLVWSEEAQPNLGYEAGGYNNAWTLGQTDQDRFFGVAATDGALYAFRARSITYVIGAITTDFSTTGTREAVSSILGTTSPASIYVHDAGVYFAGSDKRLYKITRGHALQEVATGCRVLLSTIPTTRLPNVVAAPWTEGDAILFGFPQAGDEDPNVFPVVSVWNDECIGVWDAFQCTSLDEVQNDHGLPVVAHFGGDIATTSRSGFAYVRGGIDGGTWGDHFASADASVERLIQPTYMGYSATTDQVFDVADISLLVTTNLNALGYEYRTSRDEVALQLAPVVRPHVPIAAGGLPVGRFDDEEFDLCVFAGDVPREQHLAIGLRATGRWWQPTFTQQSTAEGERFSLQTIAVRAFPTDRRTRIL